ncbi:hypothetical protein AAF712_011235 [Marasmius tenuissimus]|uniref:Uncharacterized protein n=1 Tax=Marasmius tenuissimus TaxID=585030 RepID=A0ABR2ZLS6_9AGAR
MNRLVPSLRRQDLSANYRSKAATARTLEATLYSNVNDSDDIGWGYLAESDCYQLPSCLAQTGPVTARGFPVRYGSSDVHN